VQLPTALAKAMPLRCSRLATDWHLARTAAGTEASLPLAAAAAAGVDVAPDIAACLPLPSDIPSSSHSSE
jgi:hypothetical protein